MEATDDQARDRRDHWISNFRYSQKGVGGQFVYRDPSRLQRSFDNLILQLMGVIGHTAADFASSVYAEGG